MSNHKETHNCKITQGENTRITSRSDGKLGNDSMISISLKLFFRCPTKIMVRAVPLAAVVSADRFIIGSCLKRLRRGKERIKCLQDDGGEEQVGSSWVEISAALVGACQVRH